MHQFATVLPEFALACLVLAILPGPATALFRHRTLRDGRSCGLAAVVGNEIGIFCWAIAAGAGLTSLLQANRLLFDALHIAGGIVLVWLGTSAWRSAQRGEKLPETAPRGRTRLGAFRASLISIAANPKAAVFAFAFYPDVLAAARSSRGDDPGPRHVPGCGHRHALLRGDRSAG